MLNASNLDDLAMMISVALCPVVVTRQKWAALLFSVEVGPCDAFWEYSNLSLVVVVVVVL